MGAQFGLLIGDKCQIDGSIDCGEERTVETDFGQVVVKVGEKWALICRSGSSPDNYLMPHEHNSAANLAALKHLGVREVVGVHSSGSLRPSLMPGSLIIPDDWIDFTPHSTVIKGQRHYLTPAFSRKVRQNLSAAAWKSETKFESGGIYWQTAGPRLETKAEIKLMSNFADLVGMGMATEAVLAQEMGLEYAAICSVDNYANGLASPGLTDESIREQSCKSALNFVKVLTNYCSA